MADQKQIHWSGGVICVRGLRTSSIETLGRFLIYIYQWRILTFHLGGGGHEMKLNAKGTVGSVGGRKLIYNKIIIRSPPLDPPLYIYIWQNTQGRGLAPGSPFRCATGHIIFVS